MRRRVGESLQNAEICVKGTRGLGPVRLQGFDVPPQVLAFLTPVTCLP